MSSASGFYWGKNVPVAPCVVRLFLINGRVGVFADDCFFVSVRLSLQREVAIVLFWCDCSQHIPSPGTAHALVRGSARVWQMLMYRVQIPRRKGHSNQRAVLADTHPESPASTVRLELAQAGGISGCVKQTRIEQPLTNQCVWCLLMRWNLVLLIKTTGRLVSL